MPGGGAEALEPGDGTGPIINAAKDSQHE